MIHTSLIDRYIILHKTLLAIMSLYTCILQKLRSCPCKIKTIALLNWLVLLVMQILLYCMYEQYFFPNNFMINLPSCFNSWFMCSNLHSISFECLYKILIAPEWSNLSSFFIMEYKPCSLHFNEGYENPRFNIISDYSTSIETDQKKYLAFNFTPTI